MKKALFLSLALLLAGCSTPSGSAPSTETPVTVTDGIGRTVTAAPSSIKKVVCVGAGALRVYSYVGDMNLLSGVEDIDNPDKSFKFTDVARPYYMANAELLRTLPTCGTGGPQGVLDTKKILECEPDLVISEYEDAQKAELIEEQTGAKVFTVVIGNKACFDDVFASTITSLAKLLGREERATAINNYIANAKADIDNRTKDIAEADKPNVYLCGIANWGMGGYRFTSANYPLFNQAHIKNIVTADDMAEGGKQIKAEAFETKASSMDIMILDAASLGAIKSELQLDEHILDNCKAVNDGKVYLQMAYNAYYTNIEISLMDAYFEAASVYPSKFADVDLEAKYNEITTLFNGKALYNDIKALPGSRGGYQQIRDLKAFLAA